MCIRDRPQNVLTPAEIDAASCIVVAADRTVDLNRFAGKPVLIVPVAEALRQPEALLRRAVSGGVPVMNPGGREEDSFFPPLSEARDGLRTRGRHVYQHLMNGINHMIPFVTGGGILIALGYFLDRANVGDLTFGSGTSLSWLVTQVGRCV